MGTTITANRKVIEDYQRLFVNRRAYVNEVDAGVGSSIENLERDSFVGLLTECSCTDGQTRDGEAGVSKLVVLQS